jgi:hypothetical protein
MDYNNFQYKMRYTAKSRISKIAKRFSTWVSYTYSVNDYEFDSFTPSNNVDIRHSASLGFNYDI